MKYSQRDLVVLKGPMPDGQTNNHPFLIISCNDVNSKGDYYTAMMMSTTEYKDRYYFPVTNEMFEGHLRKENCHMATRIIVSVRDVDIKQRINKMELIHFKNLIKQLLESVLFVDK